MNIEFKCPQCGNAVSVDESYRGQVVECPHCAKGIVVPKAKANSEAVQRPESNMVHIQCPHCGTEYEATQQDMYRLVSCEICGKNFVAGTTSRKQNAGTAQTRPTVHKAPQRSVASRQNQMPRSRPFIAIGNATPEPCTRNPKLTIWIAASAACIVVILATVFILGRYSGKSDSPATAVTMVKSEDGDKQKGSESTISTGNKVKGDLPEEQTLEASTVLGSLLGGTKLNGKNPLDLFHFGDVPRDKLLGDNTIQYEISNFLGIQQMTLGYTKKGHLFSICLVSENDHCSVSESDMRVSKLMQLCDEWLDDIKWDVGEQKHDGRKFAIGRIRSTYFSTTGPYQKKKGETVKKKWVPSRSRNAKPEDGYWDSTVYNYRDMVFSIIPTRGERNVVGLQVNLIDNQRRRFETDYLDLDIRRSFQVTDAQYKNAESWFTEQKKAYELKEGSYSRVYDGENLYGYRLTLRDWNDKEVHITLEGGVLEAEGSIPIDESYAEELINAKIIILNKEFEGIDGEIEYSRPPWGGGNITLPCPICKEKESRQREKCKCWSDGLKRNTGRISIRIPSKYVSKSDFEEEIENYKSEYKKER